MVGVDGVYPKEKALGEGCWGKIFKSLKDYGWDEMEGTGYMGDILYDLFDLLS